MTTTTSSHGRFGTGARAPAAASGWLKKALTPRFFHFSPQHGTPPRTASRSSSTSERRKLVRRNSTGSGMPRSSPNQSGGSERDGISNREWRRREEPDTVLASTSSSVTSRQ